MVLATCRVLSVMLQAWKHVQCAVTVTQKPLLMLFIAVGDGKTVFNLQ